MNWLMNDHAAGAGPVTILTVVFALLLYAALLATALGLASRYRRARRLVDAPGPGLAPAKTTALRKVLDTLILRDRLATDPWDWALRLCVTYGLALSLARHARYVASPEWTGPLWTLVMIMQPVGYYAGLIMAAAVLGMGVRMVLVPGVWASVKFADLALMALLLALAGSGYAMAAAPTDVVALKAFLTGLAVFSLRPLPADPLLLVHVWLGGAAIIVFACAKLLPTSGDSSLHPGKALAWSGLKPGWSSLVAMFLLIPAGFGIASIARTGWTRPVPSPVKLVRGHWSENPTVMTRNHPEFLRSQMILAVYAGVRRQDNTIERCVTCHAVKDGEGRPVDALDSRHFCASCHVREAVATDCFTCHKSKPAADPQPAIKNIAAIKAHLAQWSAKK